MLSINTNLSSIIAQHSMSTATAKLNQAIERMTTGAKINHAKDNAAGYSIVTNMTTKMNSYMVAQDNVAMGMDMIDTAEGSLTQIQDKFQRLRDLQTQASNGTYGSQSLMAINSEANALVDEIYRLYSTAEYNGMKLFESTETPAVAAYGARATNGNKFIAEVVEADLTGAVAFSTVDENQDLASGKYTINDKNDLKKLARMTNVGHLYDGENEVAKGTYEFILTDDIDLSGENWDPIGYSNMDDINNAFSGTFDGNGHVISNLTIKDKEPNFDTGENSVIGLFGMVCFSTIKNLGVEDINIKNSGMYTAGITAYGYETDFINVYSTGNINASSNFSSGISTVVGSIVDSYSTATLSVVDNTRNCCVAGLAYIVMNEINNSFFAGNLTNNFDDTNDNYIAPLVIMGDSSACTITNSYYASDCMSPENLAKAEAYLATQGQDMGVAKSKEEIFAMFNVNPNAGGGGNTGSGYKNIGLQVGIDGSENSRIEFNMSFGINGIDNFRSIGLDTTTDFLTLLDENLASISNKLTEFGSITNRLESVLDEIEIQYNNLASSRSTIRDADIAEVSSHYIQQQILQQASATLLATANQTPSIALQLI